MKTPNTMARYALAQPEILMPRPGADLSRWAVIACDQYTQDREYWKKTAEIVGSDPSILNIILPEVYLEDAGRSERLASIRAAMAGYLGTGTGSDGVFGPPVRAFVYLERKTAYGRTRKGLMAAVDLDSYEWKPDSKALVRATEATIVDRIPPRMEIRRGAPIESPHIMLLANDPRKSLIEAAGEHVRSEKPLYSAELMHKAGSVTGWAITDPGHIALMEDALENLAKENTAEDGSCFLFAVGDGNHSLATAKAVWDEFRAAHAEEAAAGEIDLENHPARYALVEIVNLYDDGLTFEPIHRVLFGTDARSLAAFLAEKLGGTVSKNIAPAEMEALVADPSVTRFGFVCADGCFVLETPHPALAVSRLQPVLDDFLSAGEKVKIDYIHGTDEVFRLGKDAGTVSILLPPVAKDSFFSTIAGGGPLPRKSFSMGEASEKRFYMESRKLF
ncbi:MAG TPA: DUF1015 domain-containing protein [Treponemataceae bacterium]|nr:DUF1015 domain-containing protein [Treponemataceae bacterium]